MNILDINAKNIQLLKDKFKNKSIKKISSENTKKSIKSTKKSKRKNTNNSKKIKIIKKRSIKKDNFIKNIKIYRFYPEKKLLTYEEKLQLLV